VINFYRQFSKIIQKKVLIRYEENEEKMFKELERNKTDQIF